MMESIVMLSCYQFAEHTTKNNSLKILIKYSFDHLKLLLNLTIICALIAIMSSCTWQDGLPYAMINQVEMNVAFANERGRWQDESTLKTDTNY
jgi:hypothetical protein